MRETERSIELLIYSKQKGFTVVELLVAMAISAIVITAIYSTYLSQNKSYAIQEEVAAMQQNCRVAMEMITRDVRMAGYFGCKGDTITNTLAGSSTNDYTSAPVVGVNNDADGGNSIKDGTDQIFLKYADTSENIEVTAPYMSDTSAAIHVDDSGSLAAFDIVVISDCNHTSIFQITNISPGAGKTIVHNTGVGSPGNTTKDLEHQFMGNSFIMRLHNISYYVDTDNNLIRSDHGNPQPLAENIEDLQFAYIFEDGDEANIPDDTDADDTNDAEDVRAVRINVLARTGKVDPAFTGRRPAIEDHAAAGGTDHYRRRLLTSVIRVRNMGL